MNQDYLQIIRKWSRPQTPLPTDRMSSLRSLKDIQAVFFDIYGTLFISCSGDIGVRLSGLDGIPDSGQEEETPKNQLSGMLGKRFLELFPPGLKGSRSPLAERLAGMRGQTEDTYPQCGQLLVESFQEQVQKIQRWGT